jgi:hypothetical protein
MSAALTDMCPWSEGIVRAQAMVNAQRAALKVEGNFFRNDISSATSGMHVSADGRSVSTGTPGIGVSGGSAAGGLTVSTGSNMKQSRKRSTGKVDPGDALCPRVPPPLRHPLLHSYSL